MTTEYRLVPRSGPPLDGARPISSYVSKCSECGSEPGVDDAFDKSGHFYVNGRLCSLAGRLGKVVIPDESTTPEVVQAARDGMWLASAVPLEVQQRRANGEDIDVDGWKRPRDMKQEALDAMQKELSAVRKERDWALGRVRVLEAKLDVIRMVTK